MDDEEKEKMVNDSRGETPLLGARLAEHQPFS